MEKKNKIFLLNLFIVTIIFLIDRLCKLYVINLYEDVSNQQIFLTSFLNVYLIWNEGIAFGLLSFESLTIYNIITFLIVLINILIIYILFKLDDVRKSLTEIGVEGLTASEVRGFGRQRGQTEIYRGTEYSVSFVPKLKIELAVPDNLEEKVLETLKHSANTGQIGDGKIFVFDIKSAVRIRTGETGNNALS